MPGEMHFMYQESSHIGDRQHTGSKKFPFPAATHRYPCMTNCQFVNWKRKINSSSLIHGCRLPRQCEQENIQHKIIYCICRRSFVHGSRMFDFNPISLEDLLTTIKEAPIKSSVHWTLFKHGYSRTMLRFSVHISLKSSKLLIMLIVGIFSS